MFIDGHEREDVIKYKETFLEKMRLFLTYFMEFSKHNAILEKIYPDDCAIGGPD